MLKPGASCNFFRVATEVPIEPTSHRFAKRSDDSDLGQRGARRRFLGTLLALPMGSHGGLPSAVLPSGLEQKRPGSNLRQGEPGSLASARGPGTLAHDPPVSQ